MNEPASGRHILIAEDDETNREMLSRYLTGKGYKVTAVVDGQAALDALLEREDFDLAILDVMMPRLSGFEVLGQAREQGVQIPLIMATAKTGPDDIVRALYAGADDYVTKPYSFPVLLARMELRFRPRAPVPEIELDENAAFEVLHTDEIDTRRMRSPASLAAMQPVPPPVPPPDEEGGLLARVSALAQALRKKIVEPVALSAGTRIGDRYEVIRQIGEGGYGVVFKGRHLDLQQDVALKVLRPGLSKKMADAFRREAQASCRVRHDNSVRVYDFGTLDSGAGYLVMELLEGRSLEDTLKDGPLSIERTVSILKGVLSALVAVHRQGLVHRDVKPPNIILHKEEEREVPKLLDFGIAVDLNDASDSRAIAGSAAYIAPERLRNRRYDGRVDVYACGMMLYRMLTARYPFDFDPEAEFEKAADWHLHGAAPAPSTLRAGLPPLADELTARFLGKDPDRRPHAADAQTMIEALIWEL